MAIDTYDVTIIILGYEDTRPQRRITYLYMSRSRNIIKSQIMTGELLAGKQIPTEKEFAETYRVSSITVRQAILDLVKEGLLLRKQGKGTFVTQARQTPRIS